MTLSSPTEGTLLFRMHVVQRGRGPHYSDFAYTTDDQWDAFRSDINVKNGCVRISNCGGRKRFGINVRWNVEGFGYTWMTADNGGEYYELPAGGLTCEYNLNYELAKSRVIRNRARMKHHTIDGFIGSHELHGLITISENYLADASAAGDSWRRGELSQTALLYALKAGEAIELEKAQADILRNGARSDFFFGCDARGVFEMEPELFFSRFSEVFDYATITHYLIAGVFQDFEPEEGVKRFDLRDGLFRRLKQMGITVEGRPLWWSYLTTTPDWLRNKSYDEVRKYVEKHVREVVGHYGDGMYAWEVVNEFHDWANECKLTPDQITELTRLACDVARDTNPKVKRLINNCAPFGEYVQQGKMTELDAFYPQRTPFQFVKGLAEAGVDFDITGIQMYFPYRDLADIILLVEKFRSIGKRIQLTEIGASSGPSAESIASGQLGLPTEPYAWRRQWDEELQADWTEAIYTLCYSRPYIEAANWYDFDDPHSWIPGGGLLRSPKGEPRAAFDRLRMLKHRWKSLPKNG